MTRRSKELKKTATWMSRSDGVPAAPRFVRASLGGLTRRWGSCGSGGSRFLRGPGAAALWTTRGGPDGNKRLSAAGCTWGGGLARVGRRGGRHPRPRAWCRGQGRRGHLRTRRREVVDGGSHDDVGACHVPAPTDLLRPGERRRRGTRR